MVMVVIMMALIDVLIAMTLVIAGDVNVTRAIHVTHVTPVTHVIVATPTITGVMAVGVGEVDTTTVMDAMANTLKNAVEAITITIESKSVIFNLQWSNFRSIFCQYHDLCF